jgi:hypothetical protein
MTDEPIRPIEEQLIRSAQKRRSQATDPFQLHPVTRDLLQAEVARTYPPQPTPRPHTPRPWWTSLSIRFALATTAAAVLLFAVFKSLEPTPAHFQLAQLEEAPAAPDLFSRGTTTPQHPTADFTTLPIAAESPQDHTPSAHTAKASTPSHSHPLSPPAASPAPTAPVRHPALATPTPSPRTDQTQVARRAHDLPTLSLPSPPPDPQPTAAAAAQHLSLTASQSLQFTQLQRERVNLQSPPMPEVLRSFEFIQSNDTIRIVDADGSIYTGTTQPTFPPESTRFVATGTNRSTQYHVVFHGALQQAPFPLPKDHAASTLGITTPASPPTQTARRLSTAPHPLQQSPGPLQIVGHASLNDHTRFEIRAVLSDQP